MLEYVCQMVLFIASIEIWFLAIRLFSRVCQYEERIPERSSRRGGLPFTQVLSNPRSGESTIPVRQLQSQQRKSCHETFDINIYKKARTVVSTVSGIRQEGQETGQNIVFSVDEIHLPKPLA